MWSEKVSTAIGGNENETWKEEGCYTHRSKAGVTARHAGPQGRAPCREAEDGSKRKPWPEPLLGFAQERQGEAG